MLLQVTAKMGSVGLVPLHSLADVVSGTRGPREDGLCKLNADTGSNRNGLKWLGVARGSCRLGSELDDAA